MGIALAQAGDAAATTGVVGKSGIGADGQAATEFRLEMQGSQSSKDLIH